MATTLTLYRELNPSRDAGVEGDLSILALHRRSKPHRRHLTALSHSYRCLLNLHSWAGDLLWDLARLASSCSAGRRAWFSGQTWKISSQGDKRRWGEHHCAAPVQVLEQRPSDSKCFMTASQMWHFFSCKAAEKNKRVRSNMRWLSGLSSVWITLRITQAYFLI